MSCGVNARRDGRCVYYRVRPSGMKPLLDWIAHYRAFWTEHIERLEQLLEKLDEAARAQTSAVPALEAVFRAHVAFVFAHPGVPRIIFHELQQPADSPVKQEVRALLQAYRQLLLNQFKRGMKSGELPTGLDPEAAATLFVGIVQGLVMQSMLTGKPGAMKAQGDGVFAIYLRGIQAAV